MIELYQRTVSSWSQIRGDQVIEKAWLDQFLALLPDEPEVLDLGCGTGVPIAGYLIEHGCQIVGVDGAAAMISICKNQFPEHDWHVEDMRTLALDRAFCGIIAWNSLFHLPVGDQEWMFPIFSRHVTGGGALMFTTGPSAGVSIGTYQGERLYHASMDEHRYRMLLSENGFDVLAHKSEDPDCGRHTVWLARRRQD